MARTLSTAFAVEARGLVKRFGDVTAVDGLDLAVRPGICLALLGPNGAGKTTLMKTIAGVLKPRRGSIRLDGVELAGLAPSRIVARGVALVVHPALATFM